MKNKKITSFLLVSTSSFAFFGSAGFTAKSIQVSEIPESSYWGRTKTLASNTLESVVDIVDEKAKNEINAVAVKVSDLVESKLNDFLYLDKERYGKVSDTGQAVKIYMNQSQVVSKLFETVTGKSINKFVDELPVGVKHVAGVVKGRLEKAMVAMIAEMTVKPVVKDLTEKALLETYDQSKNSAYKFVNFFNGSKDKTLEAKSSTVSISAQENNLKPQEAITLENVVNKYLYDIKIFLNNQLHQIIDESISQVKNGTVSTGANQATVWTKNLMKAAGAYVGSGAGFGAAYLAGEALTSTLKSFYGTQTQKLTDPIFNHAKTSIGSHNVLHVDYEHAGRGTFREIEDDFLSLEVQVPTFTAYATELASQGAKKVVETARNVSNTAKKGITKLKETVGDVTKDFDGQAGIQAAASNFHTQLAGPAQTVNWDNPYMMETLSYMPFELNPEFEKSLSAPQPQASKTTEGTLSKLKGWFGW